MESRSKKDMSGWPKAMMVADMVVTLFFSLKTMIRSPVQVSALNTCIET